MKGSLSFAKEEITPGKYSKSALSSSLSPLQASVPNVHGSLSNLAPSSSIHSSTSSDSPKQASPLPEEHIPDSAAMASEALDLLPYTITIYLPSGKSLSVTLMESFKPGAVLHLLAPSLELAEVPAEVYMGCRLVAADEQGAKDDSIPLLDESRPIHSFGLSNFLLEGKQSKTVDLTHITAKIKHATLGKRDGIADPQAKFLRAAEQGDMHTLRSLVSRGQVRVSQPAQAEQATALHYAVRRGHLAVVSFLLKSGCELDMVDSFGRTPLHLACQRGHVDIAEVLLTCGADSAIADAAGKMPLEYVAERDDGSERWSQLKLILESS